MVSLQQARSLHLHAGDDLPGAGESVEVGMVVVRGALFVRAHRGTASVWYQAAIAAGRGWIQVGTLRASVDFSTVDESFSAEIDAAYVQKYAHTGADLVAFVLSPAAQQATLRVTDRGRRAVPLGDG
jgi:hypothetical protein